MYREQFFAALTTLIPFSAFALMLALLSALASIWAGGPQPSALAASKLPGYKPPVGMSEAGALTPTPTTACRPWSVVPSGNVNTLVAHYLTAVSATSADDAWAVGYYGGSGCCYQTLTEHWDGTQWTVIPSPNSPISLNNYLYGVAAIASNDVWAVGYTDGNATRPLAMHWDGTQWTILLNADTASSPTIRGDRLFAVSAIASNDVWAVGYSIENTITTLTMHWDGTQWSVVPSANTNTSTNRLYGVAAISANDVWAVGEYEFQNLPSNILVTHWDGASWRVVQVPYGGLFSELRAVSASSANDVWAVGVTQGMGETAMALAMHWNGTDWAIPANTDLPYVALNGVAAIAPNDVWAVGSRSSGVGSAFIEHWNGTQWSVVPGPAPSAYNNGLAGVDALSAGDVWAVGRYIGAQSVPFRTLTERYTGGIIFSDVLPTDYFYEAVNWLHCRGAVSGYDGTFRPYNETTRGQLTKIIVLAEGWTLECPTQHFSDVPPTHTFFCYIETAYAHGIISGYANGTFRPSNDVTRAQLCKIMVLAEGWTLECPTQHFSDVPPNHAFYCYIETAYAHSIISGYADGTFHPGDPARRGQIAKIVYQAVHGP